MATPSKKTAKTIKTTKAKAAPKKAATRKAVTADEVVSLTPDEVARRERKDLFLGLVNNGIAVPYALQQEFAPASDAPAPTPVAAAPVAAQGEEDPYDADNGRSALKPRIIRNLRNVTVHMRLDTGAEKPFRVQLKPRGLMGDTVRVPAKATDDITFTTNLDKGVIEIISRHEQQNLQYGDAKVSHAQRMGILDWNGNPVTVGETTRDADRTVSTTQFETAANGQVQVTNQQMDQRNQPVQQPVEPDYRAQHAEVSHTGPRVVNVPGSDQGMTAQFAPTARPLDTVQGELAYHALPTHATPSGKATGASAMPAQPPVVQSQVQHFQSDVPTGTPSRQVATPQ